MVRRSPLWLAFFSAFLLAGCPQALDQSGTSVDTGGSPSDDARPIGDASDIQGTQVSRDSLTDEFPGCNEPADGAALQARIIELVNQVRLESGLGEVTHNETLEAQASQYACELLFYDFFAHQNPITGSTLRQRAEEFGYDFSVIGENLAAGQLTPEQAFNDWMESPGHRANILDPRFTELGVGIRRGGSYGWYWVQEFGRPVTLASEVLADASSVANSVRQ